MMKVSGRITVCCTALILVLTSVSAVQRLNSISDLKRVDFGRSVPKHSLVLLHWFANTVTIDSSDVIWPNFSPNSGDYGSHHYRNDEMLLDPLPRGTRYFTVGNVYQDTARLLPSHVVRPRPEYAGRNGARIIVRVREQNVRCTIDQVYITQHYETSDDEGTDYDPDHTYLVTTNLLREIRQFSLINGDQGLLMDLRDRFGSSADDSELNLIRNTWGHLACLGLLLHIVVQESGYSNQVQHEPQQHKEQQDQVQYGPQQQDKEQQDQVHYRPQQQHKEQQVQVHYRPQQQYKEQQDQVQYRPQSATRRDTNKDVGSVFALIVKCVKLFLFILFALAILILSGISKQHT